MKDQFFPNGWSSDAFDENPVLSTSNPSFEAFSTPSEPIFECPFTELYPYVDGFTVSEIDSSYNNKNDGTPPFPIQEEYPYLVEDEDISLINSDLHGLEERITSCKVEMEQSMDSPVFNLGLCGERKIQRGEKNKKKRRKESEEERKKTQREREWGWWRAEKKNERREERKRKKKRGEREGEQNGDDLKKKKKKGVRENLETDSFFLFFFLLD